MGRKTELSLKSSTICSSSWQWPPPSQFPSFTFQDSILNFPVLVRAVATEINAFISKRFTPPAKEVLLHSCPFKKLLHVPGADLFIFFIKIATVTEASPTNDVLSLIFFNNDHILLKISNPSERVWSEYTSSGRILNPIDTDSSTILHICHFWYTATLIRPVKGTPKSV